MRSLLFAGTALALFGCRCAGTSGDHGLGLLQQGCIERSNVDLQTDATNRSTAASATSA